MGGAEGGTLSSQPVSRNGTLDALKSAAEQEKQNEIHGHPGGRKVDLILPRARGNE